MGMLNARLPCIACHAAIACHVAIACHADATWAGIVAGIVAGRLQLPLQYPILSTHLCSDADARLSSYADACLSMRTHARLSSYAELGRMPLYAHACVWKYAACWCANVRYEPRLSRVAGSY